MFWKQRKTPEEQVKADTAAIIASLGPRWRYFYETLPFKDNVPLSDRIEAFATPAISSILQNYPSTKHAPNSLLWLMIFTAVRESETHSMAELNVALAELQKKYAG